eukprot:TRINITY_DN7812_c0_g1_i1.p1 TRINITY_DN7812_c0_g1~~TRINITY_DN7812_c0_g1_i1.p1  ORF type:complete len:705 (-),score=180.13 TRINITY_DN7812_c0_g1_i1:49-2163(-)
MATLVHCSSPSCKLCIPNISPHPSSQSETLLTNSQSLKKSNNPTPTTPQSTKSHNYKNTTVTPPHFSVSSYTTPEKKSPYKSPKSSEKYGSSNNQGFVYDVLPPPRSPFTTLESNTETKHTPKITNKQSTPKNKTPSSANKFVFPEEEEGTVDTPSKGLQVLPPKVTKVQEGFEIQDYGSFLESENPSMNTSFNSERSLTNSTSSLTNVPSYSTPPSLQVIEDTADLLVDYEQAEKERVNLEVQKHMDNLIEKYKKISENAQREEEQKNKEYEQRLKRVEQEIKAERQRQQAELGELIQTLERNTLSQKVETNRRVNEIIENNRKRLEDQQRQEQENRQRVEREREQERLRNEEKLKNEERLRNEGKAREEERRKNEEKLKLQAERGSSSSSSSSSTSSSKKDSALYVSERALAESQQIMNSYAPFETALREIEGTPAYSLFRRNYYKRINTMILQIAADLDQCRAKVQELNGVLNEARRDPTPPQVGGLPIAYVYCLDQIAAKFLSQTKASVSAFQAAAFPLAFVAVEVCKLHPPLLDFILAHFFQTPYTLPRYLPREEGETEDAFLRRMGYQENPANPNGLETQQQYWGRMSGIIAFFSAFMQTPSRGAHPFGLDRAWTYLSRLLNMKPRKIPPTLLLAFLEIAGYEFSRAFPTQLRKIFQYINTQWMPLIPKDPACAPAYHRLESYIRDYLTSGRKNPPEG